MAPGGARRACVIGAQGALGSVLVKQFESAGWRVTPTGRRSDPRKGFRKLDLDRVEPLDRFLGDVDLVVSSVPHPGFAAERAVLEQGGTLINCADVPARKAAALGAEVGEPKGTVLLNAGMLPGVANLLAAELLEKYPQADCLEVGFTVHMGETSGNAGAEWAHRALTCQRHHRVIKLPLPEPYGELKFMQVAEPEDVGLGAVAGDRRNETYLGFVDRPVSFALRVINGLRLMSLLPRFAFVMGRTGATEEASTDLTLMSIAVRRGSERLGVSILECDGDYRTTAAVARVFAEALLDRGSRPGCFNPEDLFSLDDLLLALENVDLRITRNWCPKMPSKTAG